MQIFTRISDYIKNVKELEGENMIIRKSKKKIEKQLKQIQDKYNILMEKYTEMLEEKSNNYNMQVITKEELKKVADERRILKKKVALQEETINELNSELLKLEKKHSKSKATGGKTNDKKTKK